MNLPLSDPLYFNDSFWEIILGFVVKNVAAVSDMAPTAIVIDFDNHEKDDTIVMDDLLIIHVLNQVNRKALERVIEVHLD